MGWFVVVVKREKVTVVGIIHERREARASTVGDGDIVWIGIVGAGVERRRGW